MKKNKLLILVPLLVIIIDQITKLLIRINLNLLDTITIIKNFFYITYTMNIGAAWSILEGSQLFLIVISIIFLVVLILFLKREENLTKLSLTCYLLVIGGIIGNLIDRIFLNGVVDFLSFKIFNYYFPIFNIADSSIVVGVIILLIDLVRSEVYARVNSRNRRD